jgi:D-xylose transport system permease protein
LVPVLLLGDIDLSAGVAGGSCAAVMANLMLPDYNFHWAIAVLVALATGAAIGLTIGLLVALLGVPSFVVTLAFFLALQGITLTVVGQGGSLPVREGASGPIYDIANNNMPVVAGWVSVVAILALYAAITLRGYRTLVRGNLQRPPMALVVLKLVGLSVVLLGATYLLSINRAVSRVAAIVPPPNEGFPWVVPLVGVLFIALTFVFSRTTYGRHVYAVGGNREAARRAGIDVTRIRISVFVICTMMAAISGIITASRQNGVDPGAGGGNVLLYAVGAAVIGGTSLFGGKGHIRDAIIGGLVIAIIANGLGLLVSDAYINFLVTGAVLLLAATVDAISRRRRSATGL